MTKKKDDDSLSAPAEPTLPQFNVAPASDPENVVLVTSFDASIEEAVRQYNVGRMQPLTAKQLIITFVAPEAV